MGKHLQHDLDDLKKEILGIGSLVEEATNKAIMAITTRRSDLADEVIESDGEIDEREVYVETECMKVLALHQPVAADLRFVVAVLKVNNDLERIGDLAVNIAKRAQHLSGEQYLGSGVDLSAMCERVRTMVRKSLDALVRLDPALAREVCALDQAVDDDHRNMILQLKGIMQNDPDTISRGISTLWVSRCLERIADLATNIAEDVVFLVEGEVIRHGFARGV
jgi:phosphate transport system protein